MSGYYERHLARNGQLARRGVVARRRTIKPVPMDDVATMEAALWLMGLARRPGVIVRLELDSFPIEFRSRWRA